jgi:hypothetical protein
MLDAKGIASQQELLAAYRHTLDHLLHQAAQYGGVVFAPPATENGIQEAQAQIRRLKTVLREHGVAVDDQPCDEALVRQEQSESVPIACRDQIAGDLVAGDKVNGDLISVQNGQSFVNRPTGPITQHFIHKDKIDTGGGDYAEGNIDKRNLTLVSGGAVQGSIIGSNLGIINENYITHTHNTLRTSAVIPLQAPPLPAHFVPRPEVTQELKMRLLTDVTVTTPGILVVSAIHGLGGLGKSTLAAALAHDPEIQRHFSDGILWATLGQEPDVLSLVHGWVQALGDYDFHASSIEAASAYLRGLLQKKAVLLVVDDVWHSNNVSPFLVSGSRSSVLITTRRADVADEIGANLYELDVMTSDQSLALFSLRLQRELEGTERQEALLLAKEVGFLPLALELVTARIARGSSWVMLRDAIKVELSRLESPRHRRTGHTRLEASFNLSLNALRTDDEKAWRCFLWLGILPEDVIVAAPMVAISHSVGSVGRRSLRLIGGTLE